MVKHTRHHRKTHRKLTRKIHHKLHRKTIRKTYPKTYRKNIRKTYRNRKYQRGGYQKIEVEDNRVFFFGNITYETAMRCIENLQIASLYDDSEIIEFHISSPGGDFVAAEKIIDAMEYINKPIYSYIHNTRAYTGVASAASVIVSHTHMKYIYSNATFMIHHASEGNSIIEKDEDILYWMHHTNLDFEILNNLIKNEIVIDAVDAKNLGFVDEVLPIE